MDRLLQDPDACFDDMVVEGDEFGCLVGELEAGVCCAHSRACE